MTHTCHLSDSPSMPATVFARCTRPGSRVYQSECALGTCPQGTCLCIAPKVYGICGRHGALVSSPYPEPDGDSSMSRQSHQVQEPFASPASRKSTVASQTRDLIVRKLDAVSGTRRASESTSPPTERKEKTAVTLCAVIRVYGYACVQRTPWPFVTVSGARTSGTSAQGLCGPGKA